jgi:uncharacterized protein
VIASDLELQLHGEALVLTTARAIYWRRTQTLLVADLHLGKAHTLRASGIAVPSGDTQADFAGLQALIQRFAAQRLLVLGDLVHSPVAGNEPWLLQWHAFTATCKQMGCAIAVVRGNHDRRIEALGSELSWIPEHLHEPPFVFCHDLAALAPSAQQLGYAMAGHVHPVLRYRLPTGTLRLPVYHFARAGGLLPAFGAGTGGFEIHPQLGDQSYAIADRVLRVRAQQR